MTYRNLPNALTMFRAVLALVFFLVLNNYRYNPDAEGSVPPALIAAFLLFLLAAFTDWADGYLARKLDAVSAFGRIMDPFCDKLLIMGALIYLAGPRFIDPQALLSDAKLWGIIPGNMISGVYPWMVVVMLARELLVTGIRGEMEGRGIEFGAKLSGKLKTVLQMIIVPTVIVFIGALTIYPDWDWVRWLRDVLVYLTVIMTVVSGVPYVTHAIRASKPV